MLPMGRRKSQTDSELLAAISGALHDIGPSGFTFAAVGQRVGLSPSTLVQRFGSKQTMLAAALQHEWDVLVAHTAALTESMPHTPEAAVDALVGLSVGYGDLHSYADSLLILREDLRDPDSRARGTAWERQLHTALTPCYAHPDADGITRALLNQWQGAMLWWSFDPVVDVSEYVRNALEEFHRLVLD